MEIKLNAGDKITIPTGCKATIEDDLIIIEEKQEEFKNGDILLSNITGRVVIFKSYEDGSLKTFCTYYNNTNNANANWANSNFRHATEKEKQAFFDELKVKGLQWNAETKEMERVRQRANLDEYYLFISLSGEVFKAIEIGSPFDDKNYNLGNYYLPEAREQAEEDAKALKAFFEKRLKAQ